MTRVFAGESIHNFKPLLQRFYHSRSVLLNEAGKTRFARTRISYFPVFRGRWQDGIGINASSLGFRYTYSNTTLLHWVSTAFRTMRGSIRLKIIPEDYENFSTYVERYSDIGLDEYEIGFGNLPTYATQSEAARDSVKKSIPNIMLQPVPFGAWGATITVPSVNPIHEVEIPFYTSRRFASARHENWAALDTFDLGGVYIKYLVDGAVQGGALIDLHYAAGVDFSLNYFMGLPRMYYEPVPAPPFT